MYASHALIILAYMQTPIIRNPPAEMQAQKLKSHEIVAKMKQLTPL
jgi:hypothetical protein